jgi:cyclase
MFRPRIIPVLLIKNKALVKSIQFKNHKYIGDPINTVKIFNDLKADELIFLDIDAKKEKRLISIDFVKTLAEETNMPFGVGGGIRTINDIQKLIAAGAEKVILSSIAFENPGFVIEAVENFGSSTITICLDVKKNMFGKQNTYIRNGSKRTNYTASEFAKLMENNGAGEIIIQSIEKDGTMDGYDLNLIAEISNSVTIPVVALGGAGTLEDVESAYFVANANAMAAGSLFIYQSKKRGVLVNYPNKTELTRIFSV